MNLIFATNRDEYKDGAAPEGMWPILRNPVRWLMRADVSI